MTDHRILITGTREELTAFNKMQIDQKINDVLVSINDRAVIVHGDCPTGVDAYVQKRYHEQLWGVVTEPHPADWSLGRKAGPLRNQKMVDLGADICLAFPKGESRGTRGCARMAQAAGIPTIITEL